MKPTKQITDDLFKYSLPDKATEEQKEANPIAGQEVAEALKVGKSVEIRNAVIEGPLILESLVIPGKVTIQHTTIKGLLDCSYAEFRKVVDFKDTTFESNAIFKSANIDKDIILDEVTFKSKTEFTDLEVKGALYGKSSTFWKNADFMATVIGRRAVLIEATFMQKAMFTGSHIEGAVFFNNATFKGEANFINVHIKGRAVFDNTIFENETNFVSAWIGGCAEFNDAKFKNKVFFQRVHIEETAFFKNTNFYKYADFAYIQIQNNPEFTDSIFHEKAVFNSVYFKGHALFNPVIFKMDADFAGAIFWGGASFAGAQFMGHVDFYNSQSRMDVGFGGAVFTNDVSFQNSSLRTVFFGTPEGKHETKFEGKIDLRGCTYDLIQPIFIWEKLLEKLDPYDRQPFTQLEQTFRKAGHDDLANEVYYKRKRVESTYMKFRQKRVRRGLDWLHWTLTKYGLQPWRLLIALALIVLVGAFIFQIHGAVELKQDIKTIIMFGPQPGRDTSISLTYVEALRVSLNSFLPVEIPTGSQWKASSNTLLWIVTFSDFATFWRLLGWILVPVWVAGISGLLKR